MVEFKSVDEILDFAILNEEKAAKFYMELASNAPNSALEQAFKEFAAEEGKHRAKLIDVKNGKTLEASKEKVLDIKIAEMIEPVEDTDSVSNYQQALVLAMNREKRAYMLYTNLSKATDDEGLINLFKTLAQEEAKHKLFFEVEYDNIYLAEN